MKEQNHSQRSHLTYLISVGLAMFSMFFGAGNVVFPLLVGQQADGAVLWAFIGLLITAVGVPFCGLLGVTLFDGEYRNFFSRMGGVTGFCVVVVLMGLVGPLGALPRCVALSYATAKHMIPTLHLELYCAGAILVVYYLTVQKSRVIEIIGNWLSPILIISLAVIIVKGLLDAPSVENQVPPTQIEAFSMGLSSGYQTMDLIGAFFFCTVVVNSLRRISVKGGHVDRILLTKNTMIASLIGAGLLGLVYLGMSFVAARHTALLSDVSADVILGTIAHHILGPYAGFVTSTAVILACLTTAIALAAVFADFLHNDVSMKKISYKGCLTVTCAISFFFATLEFSGIFRMLAPIVEVLYPSLIVLTLLNIANKLWGVRVVKTPVFIIFILSLISSLR